jgi:anti-sigma factor RsiW
MDHEKWREMIFSLRDGALIGEERRAAQAHLVSCAACREEQARWSRAATVLFKPAPEPRTELFVQKVMARLEEPAEPAFFAWPRWLAVAAIPALAGMMFFLAPAQEADVSTDALLMSEAHPGPAMMLSKDAPGEDALMGAAWEEDI